MARTQYHAAFKDTKTARREDVVLLRLLGRGKDILL